MSTHLKLAHGASSSLARRVAAVALVVAGLVAAGVAMPQSSAADVVTFPAASGEATPLTTTMTVKDFDGEMKRFSATGPFFTDFPDDGAHGQAFIVEDGGTLKNVIFSKDMGDGIHCVGTCTIENVWFEDIFDDAVTMDATATADDVVTITTGGARLAEDKLFQSNGAGKMVVKSFKVDGVGKFWRSCGNCPESPKRTFEGTDLVASGITSALIGVNEGDEVTLTNVKVLNTAPKKPFCQLYKVAAPGQEPTKLVGGDSGIAECKLTNVTRE